MGAHYGSVQVRSEDRGKVKVAAEKVAQVMNVRMLVSPALNGWIGLYPENNGQDETLGEKLAQFIDGYLLQILVHDDSIFVYWLYHDGKLIDSYHSSPGYFGERTRSAEEKMVGNHELFRPLIGEMVNHLPPILERNGPQPVFLSEKLEAFSKLLQISNALQAYEYIKTADGARIEGNAEFEEIPEKQSARGEKQKKPLTPEATQGMESATRLLLASVAKSDGGDIGGALADLTAAISLSPKMAFLYVERGNIKRKSGDLDGALLDFDKAIELKPDDADFYLIRGDTKRMANHIQDALDDYDRAIELDATMPLIFNNRGFAKKKLGDLQGALFDYDQAIDLDPKFAAFYKNRGDVKRAIRNFSGALTDYNKSIELRADNAIAHNNRALTKSALGDLEGAMVDYNRAIQLKPKHANLANILKNREVLLRKIKDKNSP